MFTEALSRRERQIMDVIYARSHATAAEVVAGITDPPSKTAVRTLLTILERKGHLSHVERDGAYVYSPTRPREQAARSALRRVLDTFFGGSLGAAVSAHLADESAHIDDAEIKRLAHIIRTIKREGK